MNHSLFNGYIDDYYWVGTLLEILVIPKGMQNLLKNIPADIPTEEYNELIIKMIRSNTIGIDPRISKSMQGNSSIELCYNKQAKLLTVENKKGVKYSKYFSLGKLNKMRVNYTPMKSIKIEYSKLNYLWKIYLTNEIFVIKPMENNMKNYATDKNKAVADAIAAAINGTATKKTTSEAVPKKSSEELVAPSVVIPTPSGVIAPDVLIKPTSEEKETNISQTTENINIPSSPPKKARRTPKQKKEEDLKALNWFTGEIPISKQLRDLRDNMSKKLTEFSNHIKTLENLAYDESKDSKLGDLTEKLNKANTELVQLRKIKELLNGN